MFTIGHGSRPLEEFIALLKKAGVRCLVDVRAYPASRRHPQFALEMLKHSLAAAGISYAWEGKMMGGRRRAMKNSPHAALRHDLNPVARLLEDGMLLYEGRTQGEFGL